MERPRLPAGAMDPCAYELKIPTLVLAAYAGLDHSSPPCGL